MALTLQKLRKLQKTKTRMRVGRGNASGKGSYSGRGIKGQKARTGGKSGLKRMGLKQYLMQIPKSRGFKRSKSIVGISLTILNAHFSEGTHIHPKVLVEQGLVPAGSKVKIIGGNLTKKFSISAHAISSGAKKALEKAGGNIRLHHEA